MNRQIRQKSLMMALAIALLVAALRFGGSLLGFEGIPVARQRPALGLEEEERSSAGGRVRSGHPGPRPGDRLAVLHLGDLERIPGSSTSGRNPWDFVDPPPRPSAFKRDVPAHVETPPMAPNGPAARLENPYPEFTLRYLGRFGPQEKKIAVFTDGRQVFNRLEGGVIDGRFVVERIGYESVDLRFVDFPDAPAKRVGVSPRR